MMLSHPIVRTVHAQEPAPASSSEPAPAVVYHPKRFPPMYPQPRAAAPQARDAERAPTLAREEPSGPPHHTGLLIAGVSMLLTSYLVAAFVGSIVSGVKEAECKGGDVADCNKPNVMLISVVGPLLPTYDPLDPLEVKLILAGPQILGAVLALAGIYQASRPAQRRERANFDVYAVPRLVCHASRTAPPRSSAAHPLASEGSARASSRASAAAS